jgi:hypothetical protein
MPDQSPTTPQPQLGFASDIKPLFRERDREAMLHVFDLWSRDDVLAHGQAILGALEAGKMPCDGAWPATQVGLFEMWLDEGGGA